MRGLIWDKPTDPTGLTGLAIFPQDKESKASNPNIEMAALLKADHDNHLGNEEINHIVNKTLYLPITYDDIKIQLCGMLTLLATLCGPGAYITRAYKTNITFHDQNYSTIADLLSLDKLAGAKMIFSYDSSLQLFLHQLTDRSLHLHEVDLSFLLSSFQQTHNEIRCRRSHHCHVTSELCRRFETKGKSSEDERRR